MPTKLQEKQEELAEKRKALQAMFEKAGENLEFSTDELSDLQTKNAELEDLGKEVDKLAHLDTIEKKNREALERSERIVRPVPFAGGASDQPNGIEMKSLGDVFFESKAFTEWHGGNGQVAEVDFDTKRFLNGTSGIEVKTLMSEAAGFAPQAIRTGRIVDLGQQQPRVVDLIPSATTDQVAVVYMRETTYTNAAAETAEGGVYPEAALAWTEISSPVRKVAAIIPATDEQLADIPGMRDRINNRMSLMVRQRLDQQIVAGDGIAPNLLGFLNTSGIQTQARGTDPGPDAILKAITKLQAVAFVEPSGIIMNPTDWQNVMLLKTSTGEYIFGGPAAPTSMRLWGLPVVSTTYITAGTALVADFAGYTEIDMRAGLEFDITNAHSDYFARGQQAIRAQLRAANVVYRTNALCSVTGL
jgi:HK97 family phage major capsid protein